MTVIAEEAVVSITTNVVPGTSFQAPDADLAVSGRWYLLTFVTPAYVIFKFTYPGYRALFGTNENEVKFT